jgi:hypothetical protein
VDARRTGDEDTYNIPLLPTECFFVNIHPKLDLMRKCTCPGNGDADVTAGRGANQVRNAIGHEPVSRHARTSTTRPTTNSNYYFNEANNQPKNVLTLNQWGARQGGPIVLHGYDGRGKAFFFFNFEQLRFPLTNSPRPGGLLSPHSAVGRVPVPCWPCGGFRSVNLYKRSPANNNQNLERRIDYPGAARKNPCRRR